jgi:hypothetical protein
MLLDINKYIEENELKEVTSTNITTAGKFDDTGLYSNKIFGLQGSKKWRDTFAYFELNSTVIHPVIYEIAKRRCSALIKLLDGRFSVNRSNKEPEIMKDSSGSFGMNYFVENADEAIEALLHLKDITDSARKLLSYIGKNKEIVFIDKYLIVPPAYRLARIEFRQMEIPEMTEKYLAALTSAQLVQGMSPESSMYNKIALQIQERLYEVYQEIREHVKGKTGVIRKSLLGKTLDFSGRAVIVGDPHILPDHIGIPFRMAIAIFKPFVIYRSTHTFKQDWMNINISPSLMTISKIIDTMVEGSKEITSEAESVIRKILNEIITEKVIIAKRDPALHKMNLRAFWPTIVEDSAIHLNPVLTKGFGADFDGDQMAVYLPLTEAAQKEAREKMLVGESSLEAPGGGLSLVVQNDLILGIYYMSMPPNKNNKEIVVDDHIEQLKKLMFSKSDPTYPVKVNKKSTSVGRAILENILNVEITEIMKKKEINSILTKIYNKVSDKEMVKILNDLTKISVMIPTIIGKQMTPSDFNLPEELKQEKEDAFKQSNPSEALAAVTQKLLNNMHANDSLLYDLIDSGARGNSAQIQQTVVAKGYVEDIDGKTIDKPIKSSINDGMTPDEYFEGAIGARKGIIDRSQSTATTGYLQRQYVYALASVKFDPSQKYCGTKKYFKVIIEDEKMAKGFLGRYLSNGKIIRSVDEIIGKTIEVYSPLYCTSPKLCRRCLGEHAINSINSVENIGIVAGQIIGERGTQLTLSTMHTGGAAELPNFMEEDTDLQFIVKQDGADIIALTDIVIEFDENEITGSNSNEYLVSVFKLKSKNYDIDFDLDYIFTIIIPSNDNVDYIDGKFIISFDKDTTIGSLKNATKSFTGAADKVIKTLNNRKLINDELVLEIFYIYAYSNAIREIWPIEVLASQLHRDPDNPSIPWRLSGMKKEPMRVSVKQVALLESWKRGAQFENVSNAFHYAILYGEDTASTSDLDELANL